MQEHGEDTVILQVWASIHYSQVGAKIINLLYIIYCIRKVVHNFYICVQEIRLLWETLTTEQAVDQSSLVVCSVWVARVLSWTAPTMHQPSALTLKMLECFALVRNSNKIDCSQIMLWLLSSPCSFSPHLPVYKQCYCIHIGEYHIHLLSNWSSKANHQVVQTTGEWYSSNHYWNRKILHVINSIRNSKPDQSIVHFQCSTLRHRNLCVSSNQCWNILHQICYPHRCW